ncbi:MAG: hypothetical protein WD906_05015 [Anaerolineales bacterium]
MRGRNGSPFGVGWAALAAILSAGGFLLQSQALYGFGFPLDDAWIHQTIARNLVQTGEWAFTPGMPGSGSTSPAWTILIALGHGLEINEQVWAFLVGTGLLATLAWITTGWYAERVGRAVAGVGLVGILLSAEWHLAWSAVSGMEVLLVALAAVLVLREVDRERLRPVWIGALIGASMWIRPESALLLAAALWRMVFTPPRSLALLLRRTLQLGAGAAVPVLLYLGSHLALTGQFWPTTFFAKSAEYAAETAAPFASRWIEQALPPLVATGFLLLPGIAFSLLRSIRARAWGRLAPWVWVLFHWTVYAIRLPVNYQHGRYAMPTIPVLLLLGVEGLASLGWATQGDRARRILGRAWIWAVVAVTAVFWWVGGKAYAHDVAIIETEMRAAARWISTHTERDALVAAHDIGALGYFGGRGILDLAGLVSPEVIPILRDEGRLAAYLDLRSADYLMTFPSLYPSLTGLGDPVFSTEGTYSPEAGGENMVVYRWRQAAIGRALVPMLYSVAGEPVRRADGNDRHFDRR